jgi:molecular chaperone DnaJ
MTLRMTNAGDAPLSGTGSPGDLIVRVTVRPSKDFRRQGTNLYHSARIPAHVAMLGGRTTVPTLEGPVEVRVQPGTQFGSESVLPGRGVVSAVQRRDKRGDLIVEYQVEVPRSVIFSLSWFDLV